ncbi:MAG: glycosyltransferase family 39 protein, partial [Thermoplasmatales archaeon]|nr:glycosyltransferase family 39 protein [Thermoplasmatales archaeon]
LGASGGRAPLFNMMALGFSRLLTPFMNEIDAIGYSMQFIPALFGALLVFPVYFIGKELFNRKAALIGALFIAIIPIHLSSGHGSAYALFDHDSFNLLLFFLTFFFFIKSLREKNLSKSVLYALLGGVPLAALSMTWVEAQYLYVVIAIYAFVQMFIDIFINKIDRSVLLASSIVLFSGYLISLPVLGSRGAIIDLNTELFLCLAVTGFGVAYYIFGRRKIPWTLSLPTVFTIGAVGLIFLYFIKPLSNTFHFLAPLQRFSTVLFGSGIYGDKVSITIAEANTYQISHTVMSFGPSLYWLAFGGLVFLIWQYYKNKVRRDYLFIIILFVVNLWLAGTAGRFLNDMVPLIAILGGWAVWLFIDWLDYKQMVRNIKSAGGGLHGLRRGIKFLHIFGILFIAFLVILPNVFVAFDAAVPNTGKLKDDGENWTTLKGYMYGDDNYR